MAQPSELVFPKLEERTSLLSLGGLMVVIASVLVVGLAILTSIIAATRRSEVQSLERKSQELETQLRSGQLALLRSQLEGFTTSSAQLKQVLEARIDWRTLFDTISRSTVKSVTALSFNFDGKSLRIDSETRDFGSVAKQVAALRQLPFVKQIEVSSISTGSDKITFSLTVELRLDQLKFKGAAPP